MSDWNERAQGIERRMAPMRGGFSGRLAFGMVLLSLGVLWTLDNLGILDSGAIVQWWPAILMLVGLNKLLGFGSRPHKPWGIVFVIVGGLLLLDSLDIMEISGRFIVPALFIMVGALLVFRRRTMMAPASSQDPSATVDMFAMWSGNVRKSVSSAFRGGDATAVMGGVDLDLRPAKIAPEGAVLEVFTWWGGIDLHVPPGTRVINEANVFMGGIDDKTTVGDASGGTLVLRGLVVMGGIEIKN